MKKKILSVILAASMILGLFVVPTVASAATSETYNLEDYRSEAGYVAPTKDGYIFAGWYYDADLTEAVAYDDVDGEAYAKFVDPAVFGVKFQYKAGTDSMSDLTDLRVITSVDSENYYSVKFAVSVDGAEAVELAAEAIYSTLYGYVDGESNPYEATIFAADSKYFAVQKVTDIAEANFAKSIEVTPVFETMDGTVVEGVARTITIAGTVPVAEIAVDAQNGTSLGFTTSGADALPVGVLTAVEGGIYVDGVLSETVTLEKTAANTYVLNGAAATPKTVVKVEGKFGTATKNADIFVAFAFEGGSWNRWAMAKTKFANLKTYDEIHGARSDKMLFLTLYDAVITGDKQLHTSNPYASLLGGTFTVKQGPNVTNASACVTVYSNDYILAHTEMGPVNAWLQEGTIVTISGVFGNYGYHPNLSGAGEYPFLIEDYSVIYTSEGWKTYVPTEADSTVTLIGFNNENNSVDHGNQLIMLMYDAEGFAGTSMWYHAIEGGFYFNGSSTPVDLNLEINTSVNNYVYTYVDHPSQPSYMDYESQGVEITEGTTLVIDGVFAHPGSQNMSFRVNNAKFIYKHGEWASYDEVATFTKHSAADAHIAVIPQGSSLATTNRIWTSVDEGLFVNGSEAGHKYQILTLNSGLAYMPYNTPNMGTSHHLESAGVVLEAGLRVKFDGVFYNSAIRKAILVENLVFEYKGNYVWTIVE